MVSSYEIKDFKHLLGLPGMSDALLTNHFALYEGYVKNVNLIGERSKVVESGTPESAELRRRFGWEWNGMRLHELYFDNLSKEGGMSPGTKLEAKIVERFGSMKAWEENFRATGTMRGIGWVMLVQDGERLFTTWVNEHDGGHLTGTTPLLVMDVFEHAFMLDYGIKRADYLDVFMKSINWGVVESRFVA